jgi:hypothetical protein
MTIRCTLATAAAIVLAAGSCSGDARAGQRPSGADSTPAIAGVPRLPGRPSPIDQARYAIC